MATSKCCVGGCDSISATHRLFTMPMNDNLRSLWMSFLVPTNPLLILLSKEQLLNRRVCHRHFEARQLDGHGRRTRYSYPCLFTAKEIEHGMPLNSEEYSILGEHNYCQQLNEEHSSDDNNEKLLVIRKEDDDFHEHSYNKTSSFQTEVDNLMVGNIAPLIFENKTIAIPGSTSQGCDCDDPLCTVAETMGIGVVRTVYVVEEIETSHELTNNHDYADSSDKVPSQSILKNYYESTAAQIKDDENVTQKKDVTNSKNYMNLIQRLNKKIVKLKRKCTMQAKLINEAKSAQAAKPFPKSIEDLPPAAKIFVKMQLKAKTKAKGRSFTVEEKIMAASILKLSPRCYDYLSKLLVLPSKRTIQRILKSSTSIQIS